MTFNQLKAKIDKAKETQNLSDEVYDYDIQIFDGDNFNKIFILDGRSFINISNCVELYTQPIIVDI